MYTACDATNVSLCLEGIDAATAPFAHHAAAAVPYELLYRLAVQPWSPQEDLKRLHDAQLRIAALAKGTM